VLGLTNDHLSYFVSTDEYQGDSYEACSSLYGRRGGEKIVEAYRRLVS
jgi:hypothetical protein